MGLFVKPTILSYALVLLSLLPIAGCWALADAMQSERFAKNKPEMNVMEGKWVPTAETVQLMSEKGNYAKVETSLELAKDGSFQLMNMPDWCYNTNGTSEGRLFRASGKWEVVKVKDWWFLSLKFESGTQLSTPSPIAEDSGNYWLWFYVGGPHGNAMIFEKKR